MWNIQEFFPLFKIIPSNRDVFIYMTNSLKDHLRNNFIRGSSSIKFDHLSKEKIYTCTYKRH